MEERCPTCRAICSGKQVCHRCGTDVGRLRDIREEAGQHLQKAVDAYAAGDFRQMYTHAERSCSLYRTPRAEILLACAALALRRWDKALGIYLNLRPFVNRGLS